MRSRLALLLSLLVVGLGAGLGAVGIATPAQAADDAYAYWLYYTVKDGEFSYQENKGPASYVPEDGSVEAYRFAAAVFPPTQEPRADLSQVDFETACGGASADEGEKRVAVLIDYGLQADAPGDDQAPAPKATCAVVPEDATGLQVLGAVTETRVGDKSSLCAIDGYPSTGCFEPAAQASPEDGEPVTFEVVGPGAPKDAVETSDDNDVLLIGGAAVVVVVLGVGGFLLSRRRSA